MYKTRWMALFLCLLVLIDACGGAVSEGQDRPSLTDVRCFFEHSVLPRVFYTDPFNVIGGMNSTSLYKSWIRIAKDFDYADSYAEADFKVLKLRHEQDIIMALIVLPAPKEAPECYRIYLCYDLTAETGLYFTNEYDEDMEGWGLVGLWTPEESHHVVYLLPPLDVSGEDAFSDSFQDEVDQIFNLVVMNRTEPLTE